MENPLSKYFSLAGAANAWGPLKKPLGPALIGPTAMGRHGGSSKDVKMSPDKFFQMKKKAKKVARRSRRVNRLSTKGMPYS